MTVGGGPCLTMIVRNEAPIIERALAAAAPWVSCYAIHDTGSTDGTPELIESVMAERGIPGEITHGTFVNFSQARNEGLAHARRIAADHGVRWLLLQDADMELVAEPGWADDLTGDAYSLIQEAGTLRYANIRLLAADAPAEYVGVTHEALTIGSSGTLDGARFIDHAAGSSREVKCDRDLRLLEQALTETPDDPRTVFYYAQTLRDAGDHQAALDAYRHRATLGGWDQERWYALWQAARLAGTTDAYLTAYDADPTRAEPLVDLAALERSCGRHHAALIYARTATTIPTPPPDALFVDTDTYTWRAWDELAIAAYWAGHHDEGRAAAVRALTARPDDERLRVNLSYFAA